MYKLALLLLCSFMLFNLGGSVIEAQEEAFNPWESLRPLSRVGYGDLQSVYWSPITGQLAAMSGMGFQFYNDDLIMEGERRIETFMHYTPLFSPDMRSVALAEDAGLIVRDTTTWEPLLGITPYSAPSWSPDSRLIALWVGERLQVWDLEAAEMRLEVAEIIGNRVPVQWSPDSQVIAIPGQGAIIMLRVDTGEIVRIHPLANLTNFQWTSDGRYFLIIGRKDPLPVDYEWRTVDNLMRMDAITGEVDIYYNVAGGVDIYGHRQTGVRGRVSISPNSRYVSADVYEIVWDAANEKWEDSHPRHNQGKVIWEVESGHSEHLINPRSWRYAGLTYNNLTWSPDGSRYATSSGTSLLIFETVGGRLLNDQPAYIAGQVVKWHNEGWALRVDDGVWDLSAEWPSHIAANDLSENMREASAYSEPRLDIYRRNTGSSCFFSYDYRAAGDDYSYYCRRYPFLTPNRFVFDYDAPPYEWRLVQEYPERGLIITFEIDIEYPGTPEYEDEEPPDERYVIWDIESGTQLESIVNLGEQTAWLYDLEGAAERRANGNTPRNVRETTRFIAIGDDEIIDLRTKDLTPLQGIQRWEWREVWFSPDGALIFAYDTDGKFKAFDPLTGEMLYETLPASRNNMWHTADLAYTWLSDADGVHHIYDTYTGEYKMRVATGNQQQQAVWHPERHYLAVGGDNAAIIIYDTRRWERLAVLRGHHSGVVNLAWHPTCDYEQLETCPYAMASVDQSGQVILWGMGDVRQVAALPENPTPPRLAPPVAEINFGELAPLWAYVSQTDEYGRPAAQTVAWSSGGIRVNDQHYYTNDFQDLEEAPEANDWYRPIASSANGWVLLEDGTLYNPFGRAVQRFTAADMTIVGTEERFALATGGNRAYPSGWVREWRLLGDDGEWQVMRWGGGNPSFNQVAASPDGRWIATATVPYYQAAGRGQIWYADQFNTQYSSLIGHTDAITQLYWLGENVITSSLDSTLRLWDIHTGEQLNRWTHPDGLPILSMVWTTRHSLLLNDGYNLIEVDAHSLTSLRTLSGLGGQSFTWSPDQSQLIVIGRDGVLRVVDFLTGAVIAQEQRHMAQVVALKWQPDGAALAVGRADGSVALLNALSGELERTLKPYGDSIQEMHYSTDGSKLLLSLRNHRMQALDSQTGEILSDIWLDAEWKREGAWWSPDGAYIAYGTYPNPEVDVYNAPSLLMVLDAATGATLHSFDLAWADYIFYWQTKPFNLRWSPDSRYLSAFYGDRMGVWDIAAGAHLATFGDAENKMDVPPSLMLWEENRLDLWRPDGQWSLDLPSRTLTKVANEGLPVQTLLRADGEFLFTGSRIVQFDSAYPVQSIRQNASLVDWHPSCWSEDCKAVLAVAQGYNVTMFGYPQEETQPEVSTLSEEG